MPPKLSSAMTLKRIHREVVDLKKEDLGPIVLAPSDDNLYLWKGSIAGPEGSVYEGGVFNFEVSLAPDYPFSAPKVVFKTRIYHMNISEQGNICIDILKHNWSPALSLFKVMLSLSSLLTDPNPKDPLVPSIATQYVRSRKLHDATARQWTQMYARPKPPPAPIPEPTASPAISAKAKGKQRADAPSAPRGAATASAIASTSSQPITIEDSDDETVNAPSTRVATARTGKRKRDTGRAEFSAADDVIEVTDESTSSKKRAVGTGRTPRNSLDTLPSGEGSDRRAQVRQLGEVIVIEDD
ncbi:putative ubiquitin-conjugating enzyme family protein [Lyophyllum shimeji]|uniref:E2 ubiquitin-conjugating enzyme n=1 Tax=Lyophyllum shimeji TaxID=47721 RepID=A0A9P3URC3_LYOSH|nr:putative ubiquitin-conjugating enzyme family protein [Lyophyllum shimeji]